MRVLFRAQLQNGVEISLRFGTDPKCNLQFFGIAKKSFISWGKILP